MLMPKKLEKTAEIKKCTRQTKFWRMPWYRWMLNFLSLRCRIISQILSKGLTCGSVFEWSFLSRHYEMFKTLNNNLVLRLQAENFCDIDIDIHENLCELMEMDMGFSVDNIPDERKSENVYSFNKRLPPDDDDDDSVQKSPTISPQFRNLFFIQTSLFSLSMNTYKSFFQHWPREKGSNHWSKCDAVLFEIYQTIEAKTREKLSYLSRQTMPRLILSQNIYFNRNAVYQICGFVQSWFLLTSRSLAWIFYQSTH